MIDRGVSPELMELLDRYKIESARIIPNTGKNIVEIFGEILKSCLRCTAVEHWLHMTTEGGKLWVGLYLLGAATEIGNSFGFDSKVSRLALAFAALGEEIFSTGDPFGDFSQITKIPAIELDSDSPIYGRNNLGAASARRWIDADFQGMFPTSNLSTILELYDKYALQTAKNIEGQNAFKLLFENISPSIKLTGTSGSKMSDDHNIASNSGSFEGTMENKEKMSNTKIVFERLSEDGFRPTLENDFSIKLKFEGAVFWVDLREDDDELYEVIAAFIWAIDSPEELANAYIAASEASRSTKVAYVYVTANKENVWVKSSMFYQDANNFANVLSRTLNATKLAKTKFIEVIRKLEAERLEAERDGAAAIEDEVEIQLHAKREGELVWSTKAIYLRSLGTISDIEDLRFVKIKNEEGFLFIASVDGVDVEVTVAYREDGNVFAAEDLPF